MKYFFLCIILTKHTTSVLSNKYVKMQIHPKIVFTTLFSQLKGPCPISQMTEKKHWLFIFLWIAVNFKSKNKNISTTMSILPTKPRNGYTYTYDHHQWPIAHWPVVASWPPLKANTSAHLQPYCSPTHEHRISLVSSFVSIRKSDKNH